MMLVKYDNLKIYQINSNYIANLFFYIELFMLKFM